MLFDHVTYQVPTGTLDDNPELDAFFKLLELREVPPNAAIEGKGWKVRWWEARNGVGVHLVEPAFDRGDPNPWIDLELGHFAVVVSPEGYRMALDCVFMEHHSPGSDRCWLVGPVGLRVEVRSTRCNLPEDGAVPLAWADLDGEVEEPNPFVRDPRDLTPQAWAEEEMQAVFAEAMDIYKDRFPKYRDNWRRYGWKGCLYDLRRKVERCWDLLWDAEPPTHREDADKLTEDAIDAVVYAAILVRAVREGRRDGMGSWWKS